MKTLVLKLGIRVVATVIVFSAVGSSDACSIPVFRYALDRWAPDVYGIEVSAEFAQATDVATVLRNLGDSSPVNLRAVVPAEDGIKESRLLFPRSEAEAWTGPLDKETLLQLTDSPARTEIARRLVSGDSGVWILLESGNAELDAAEAERIRQRLDFLETVADLPMIDPADPTSRLGPGPELRVEFSLLRLAPDDPRESVLRKMVLGPRPDDWESAIRPVAAVVFGRGRVLGAWPSKDLGDESIDEACLFLLGACSCQVKELNPGWDLMMTMDWDRSLLEVAAGMFSTADLDETHEVEVEPEAEMEPQPETESVTIRPSSPASEREEPAIGVRIRHVATGGAVMLIVGGILMGFYSRRMT